MATRSKEASGNASRIASPSSNRPELGRRLPPSLARASLRATVDADDLCVRPPPGDREAPSPVPVPRSRIARGSPGTCSSPASNPATCAPSGGVPRRRESSNSVRSAREEPPEQRAPHDDVVTGAPGARASPDGRRRMRSVPTSAEPRSIDAAPPGMATATFLYASCTRIRSPGRASANVRAASRSSGRASAPARPCSRHDADLLEMLRVRFSWTFPNEST